MQFSFGGTFQDVQLRPLEERDIEALRCWRAEPANNRYITPVGPITPQAQREWFQRVLQDKDCYTFAIDETVALKCFVGSISLYNFTGKEAEFGKFMIGEPKAHGKGLGRQSTVLTLHLGFAVLGLQTIHAVVHTENAPALKVYKQAGFSIVNRHVSAIGMPEYCIAVNKKQFYCQNIALDAIINSGAGIQLEEGSPERG